MINEAADHEKAFKALRLEAMQTALTLYEQKIEAKTKEFYDKYGKECPQPKSQTNGAIDQFNKDLNKLLEEYRACNMNGVEKMMEERIQTVKEMGIVPPYERLPELTELPRKILSSITKIGLEMEYNNMCQAARNNQLFRSKGSLRGNILQVKEIVEFTIEASRLTKYALASMQTVINDATNVFNHQIAVTKMCTRIAQPELKSRQTIYANLKVDYNKHRERMQLFSATFHYDMKTVSFNYEWRGF